MLCWTKESLLSTIMFARKVHLVISRWNLITGWGELFPKWVKLVSRSACSQRWLCPFKLPRNLLHDKVENQKSNPITRYKLPCICKSGLKLFQWFPGTCFYTWLEEKKNPIADRRLECSSDTSNVNIDLFILMRTFDFDILQAISASFSPLRSITCVRKWISIGNQKGSYL